MPPIKLHILGAGNATPSTGNLYSQMALFYRQKCALVDCGNNPINPILDLGYQIDDIEHLILTHFHPDHVAALPNFMAELKIRGRTSPLTIHANKFTIQKIQQLIALFGLAEIPGNFPLVFHVVEDSFGAEVVTEPDFSITAAPMIHFVPTIGLSFSRRDKSGGIAYTSDTQPCPSVALISEGKDILIHEATGDRPGHSSAGQAGKVAARAGVKELILIHYPTVGVDPAIWVREAEQEFAGTITLAYVSLRREF